MRQTTRGSLEIGDGGRMVGKNQVFAVLTVTQVRRDGSKFMGYQRQGHRQRGAKNTFEKIRGVKRFFEKKGGKMTFLLLKI